VLFRQKRKDRLAHAGAVLEDPPADFGGDAHGVVRLHLLHVHHAVPVEHGDVGRLAELGDERCEERTPPGPEHRAGGLTTKGNEPRAQGMSPVRQLTHVPAVDDGAHQSEGGGDRQPARRGDLIDRRLLTGGRNPLEYVEGAGNGLHSAEWCGVFHVWCRCLLGVTLLVANDAHCRPAEL